jgi:UDP-GlcNAc:undecaprenyl-phosphate GlcNAc-1-phosphate transferase
MRSAIVAFAIAALVASLLTPLVRRLALRLGAVAQPTKRDVHARAIPRLGGVAICLALFAPVVGLFFVETAVAQQFHAERLKVLGLGVGGLAMCAVGVIDDTRGIRNLYKLYAQIAVAVLAFFCGFRIEAVALPIVGSLDMGIFALPITALWIVGIINALNLIDGLDGLAAGVAFFAAITNLVVAYIAGFSFGTLIMASMLGAVLGFLLYNFNPARIFMGDSGSYLLGYVLAVTSLTGASQKASTAISLLVPVVAMGVPIFDTLFAMVRRFLERRPLFAPDRGHLHHRLLAAGVTHRRAVLIIYAISVVLTAAAIGIYLGRSWQVGLALLVVSVVVIGLVRFVGVFSMLHLRKRQHARIRSRDTELLRRALPEVPARFARARSEQELFAALGTLAAETAIAWLEVRPRDGGAEPLLHWDDGKNGRRMLAVMVYPLGRDALANAELVVACANDFEDTEMSPATDILLQVVADVLGACLTRLGSELAPRVTESTADEALALGDSGTAKAHRAEAV